MKSIHKIISITKGLVLAVSVLSLLSSCGKSYDDVGNFHEGMAAVKIDEKWGFINDKGKKVTECKFDYVEDFKTGFAKVGYMDETNHKQWGLIDKTGKEIAPCKYSWISEFEYEDYAMVVIAEKISVDEVSDREIRRNDPDGEYILHKKAGLIAFKGKWGFIDKTGKEVIPCEYSNIKGFREGIAAAEKEGKWGFIDKTNQIVAPFKYKEVRSFSDGNARVGIGEYKWGLIDRTGKEIVPCEYLEIGEFKEGMALVRSFRYSDYCVFRVFNEEFNASFQYGFIDKTGKLVIPCQYLKVRDFSNGLAAIAKLGRRTDYGDDLLLDHYYSVDWGFIDQTGREVIPCRFISVYPFEDDGMAEVAKDIGQWYFYDNGSVAQHYICARKWLYIDKKGNECFKFNKFNLSIVFSGKYGDEKRGIINRTGKQIVPFKYEAIYFKESGFADVTDGHGWGVIDTIGNEIVPCKYQYVGNFDRYGLAVIQNYCEEYGIIDKSGTEIVPCKYTMIGFKDGGISQIPGENAFYVNPRINKSRFNEYGLAVVRKSNPVFGKGDPYGVIDITGKEILPCIYRRISDFNSDGLAIVVGFDYRQYVIIDTTCRVIVPSGRYLYIRDFNEGFAAVQLKNEKWGFVNKKGKRL